VRAVGLRRYLPIEDPAALEDLELDEPAPGPRDLLVRVESISVNPIDVKQRSPVGRADLVEDPPKVLGFDAAGVVERTGPACHLFRVGDLVYYAGTLGRQGSNAELQAVDERLVGPLPRTVELPDAAALPLTSLTAWESLFDRMGIRTDGGHQGQTLLVIGGAGGVGSMAVQLGRWAGLRVVATAGSPASQRWVRDLGADVAVDYHTGLSPALSAAGVDVVDWVLCTQRTETYWEQMAEVIRPQGAVCCIVDSPVALNVNAFKPKSISVHWESMFTRSVFATDDMARQHEILAAVAGLLDSGQLRSTRTETLGPITAANLREAHRRIESATTRGKLVLAGWP
jgi:zinc-binding alcohol dehydrogenase family protein